MGSPKWPRVLLSVLWLFLWTAATGTSAAAISSPGYDSFDNLFDKAFDSLPIEGYGHRLGKRADKVPLRILPLGASITFGYMSETGNGYRKPLRDQLRYLGWEVDMVGSKSNGNMVDNDVEAHNGDIIDDVAIASKSSLQYKANVVTINAGTNDCERSIDVGNAGRRMRNLIEGLLQTDGWDRTTIILSTLLPSTDGNVERNRPSVNNQYRQLVEDMQGQGFRIVLADMDPPASDQGNNFIYHPNDFLHNGVEDMIHPNDVGYSKMAYVWYVAIYDAWDRGFLQEPYTINSQTTSETCKKEPGDGVFAGGLTQAGSGLDDGIYYHKSEEMGTLLTVTSDFDRDQWFFAKLFSSYRDDLVGWFNQSDGKVLYGTWRNTGDPNAMFVKIADMDVQDNCIPRGVHFVDINADGLDDFVCIGPSGEAYASINQGDGTTAKPPSFRYIGSIKAPIAGYDQSRVRLGDVDGDGRADYCVCDGNGDIYCWRNGGITDIPAYWQALGKRFTGKNMGDLSGVRFEDINGDGRDDWVWVGDTGQAYTWTNSRSCQKGKEGDGLNIAWRQGFYSGQSSGPTHAGMNTPGVRDRIHFARIYGEPEDFGLLGRQDYVYMDHHEEDGKHVFDVKTWKNIGSGSTKLKADGNKYCNMMGHDNGMEDYVWTLSKGQMRIYPNAGLGAVPAQGSFWGPSAIIWDPTTQAIARELDRRDLHLADWDGDGACDIIWTDPDNQNRVRLWRNTYKETGQWSWEYNADPAPSLYCPESRGIGIFDIPVRFADVSGNGRADYLCMEKDGRTWGFVNNGDNNWEYIDQFKYSVGLDRANFHFADADGDGKADLIWTDKFSGDANVWYNNGRRDIDGSRYWWVQSGKAYKGNAAGSCTYFPDLNGDGRADEHCLLGTFTNQAQTWFNECGTDHVGDDPDTGSDPQLPVMPGLSPPHRIGDGDGDGDGDDGGGGGTGVCALKFNNGDANTDNRTWHDSGASDWLYDFLKKKGSDNWTNKFFAAVINGGTLGGSTYDCSQMIGGDCPGPHGTPCDSYNPNEAIFIHIQIGNLHRSFINLYGQLVQGAIQALSFTIHDIIKEYGTPPPDNMPGILNLLAGILVSATGIDGVLGDATEDPKPSEDPKSSALGKFGGPLTILTGIFNIASSLVPSDGDPEKLKDKLEEVYGRMFTDMANTLNATVENLFKGIPPFSGTPALTDGPGWISNFFKDGAWLDSELIDPMINAYGQNTVSKMNEVILIKAMKTGNKHGYFLVIDPKTDGDDFNAPMNNNICTTKRAGCIWYENTCVCFGYMNDPAALAPVEVVILNPDEVSDLKTWISDWDAALKNNFDCIKPGKGLAGKAAPAPFDITKPVTYFPCFWDFDACESGVLGSPNELPGDISWL